MWPLSPLHLPGEALIPRIREKRRNVIQTERFPRHAEELLHGPKPRCQRDRVRLDRVLRDRSCVMAF
jgi:hypothetical protein